MAVGHSVVAVRWSGMVEELLGRVLAVIAATEHPHHPPQPGLITLTRHEIQHLFTTTIIERARRLTGTLAWSR